MNKKSQNYDISSTIEGLNEKQDKVGHNPYNDLLLLNIFLIVKDSKTLFCYYLNNNNNQIVNFREPWSINIYCYCPGNLEIIDKKI